MFTPTEKLLFKGLRLLKIPRDDIFNVIRLLKSEESQWQMAQWIATVAQDPPDRMTIFKKAVETADAYPQ